MKSISDINFAVIIPTRGDRPQLFENCLELIRRQTVMPTFIYVEDWKPKSNDCDITLRYKTGYSRIKKEEVDVIFLIEDDDYYAPDYFEYMLTKWVEHGKPDIFGTNYTIYYHLKLQAYFTMHHEDRASAMNTMIKPGLVFDWCPDEEPYTDLHLWRVCKGHVFHPTRHISLGIKHGIGMSGGHGHTTRLHRFDTPDNGFLQANVDDITFKFYTQLRNEL